MTATAVLLLILTAASAALSVLQFLHKGPPLNNAYLYASKKERAAMDKGLYYRQSGVVFALINLIFGVVALSLLLENNKLLILEALLVAITLIYAIVSSVKIEKKKKRS